MAQRATKTRAKASPAQGKFSVAVNRGGSTSARRLKSKKQEQGLTIWDKLLLWGGRGKGLPPDLAENHDHYLHGRPKV
jgi:hypothetical protein